MTVLVAMIVFGVIILVHELGHFLAARRVGIDVEEFAIGFGPKLFGFKPGATQYSVRLLPLGGYVRMLGEEEDLYTENPGSYQNKTPLQRMFVIAAGPVMNFVLALVLFMVIFGAFGIYVNEPLIGSVTPGLPAAESGLQPGDRILSMNGTEPETWTDLQQYIHGSDGQPINMTVQRDAQMVELTVVPRDAGEFYEIGIGMSSRRLPVLESIKRGFQETYYLTLAIFESIVMIFTRQIPAEDIAGPIGIVHFIGQAARAGIINVLSLAALISVNLGIFNLLPIPALDGSKLVILGVELVRRKPLDPHKENLVHLVGFALLISLMIFVMYQDILRILNM
ncbi:MAG: RIP metalloprotease RseP [Firmicutes bacterium]|nr:RIP metalloprotease RseP [Bacillota bacterium]